MNTDKLLLTDADGVLVDWSSGFLRWMDGLGFNEICTTEYSLTKRYDLTPTQIHQLVHEFNCSAAVSFLRPMPGAVIVMGKLRALGYETHCITSFGGDQFSRHQRKQMLWDFFKIPADNIHFLPMDGHKREVLERWKGSGAPWIEDKLENCFDGVSLGLDGILLRSDHTSAYVSEEVFVADSWLEVYEHITGEEKCQMNGSSCTC